MTASPMNFSTVPLPLDQPLGETLEHAHQQLLHRSEVVMDEAVVGPGLVGHPTRGDLCCADVDEQPLGGVEEGLLGLVSAANGDLRHTTYAFD
jgi:hypothetical protein